MQVILARSPEQSEFVRMEAKFGAKIVAFSVVGEDDVAKVIMKKFPKFLVNLRFKMMYTYILFVLSLDQMGFSRGREIFLEGGGYRKKYNHFF